MKIPINTEHATLEIFGISVHPDPRATICLTDSGYILEFDALETPDHPDDPALLHDRSLVVLSVPKAWAEEMIRLSKG